MCSDEVDISGGDVHLSGRVAGKARASCLCRAPSISCTSCPDARPVLEMLDGKEREFCIMRALGIAGCLIITSSGQERVDTSATCETENQRESGERGEIDSSFSCRYLV